MSITKFWQVFKKIWWKLPFILIGFVSHAVTCTMIAITNGSVDIGVREWKHLL